MKVTKRVRRIFPIVFFLGVVVLISYMMFSYQNNPYADRKIVIGAWTSGFYDDTTKTLHPEKLEAFETKIDKKVGIAHFYRGWHEATDPNVVEQLNVIDSKGWTPMLSINPYFFEWCVGNGGSLYKTIADGNCDAHLRKISQNLKQYEKPVLLRFAWEVNIQALEWGLTKTNSTPEEYASAWRRFHTIMQEEGATNVSWVFCPNVIQAPTDNYAMLYPGDAYVDWIALDGYNWGTSQSWSSWQSFDQVFDESYKQITAVAPDKPFMIAEVNSVEQGGSKADWYKEALTQTLLKKFPRIEAIVFFDEDKTSIGESNFHIDTTEKSLEAFKEGISLPNYISEFTLSQTVTPTN